MVSRQLIPQSYFSSTLCPFRNIPASIWTADDETSAHSPAPVLPSEMLLSVEPVMLTKAPHDPTQEEPQPSTSSSHFCIGGTTTYGRYIVW